MTKEIQSNLLTSKVSVIIPAAGVGKRMGSVVPKQWIEIAGKPVIYYTTKLFYEHVEVNEVILVGRAEDQIAIEALFSALRTEGTIQKTLKFAIGGTERQDSVFNGLLETSASAEIILVHDGARPFVSAHLISQMIEAAKQYGAAIPTVDVTDTIKRVHPDGVVIETLKRSELQAVQTPQAFIKPILEEAFISAKQNGILGTDDASLVELINRPVKCIPGEKTNLKLTTPEDMAHLERLIRGI